MRGCNNQPNEKMVRVKINKTTINHSSKTKNFFSKILIY
jgi:hypothetical protein